MTDKQGRSYAKLSELKVGDTIELDGGFTCRQAGRATVKARPDGALYFDCTDGGHALHGQADDGENLVGIYRA